VTVETEAGLPASPRVRIALAPSPPAAFDLKIRVPAWAGIKSIQVNREARAVRPENGYVTPARRWEAGDRLDVELDPPLRVSLDDWDALPAVSVSLDGAAPESGRHLSGFRGPAIVAQFRLAQGVDLAWAYTGDHPDLFETIDSASDLVDAGDWKFRSDKAPEVARVARSPDGVRLEWQYAPRPGWTLRRTALVHPEIPVRIGCTFELAVPSAEAARAVTSARACGVRMRTAGFADYAKARLLVDGKPAPFPAADDRPLPPGSATLDNGYVQFRVESPRHALSAADEESFASLYMAPAREGAALKAACRIVLTGQSQGSKPVVRLVRVR
jgi:hypothetical protein